MVARFVLQADWYYVEIHLCDDIGSCARFKFANRAAGVWPVERNTQAVDKRARLGAVHADAPTVQKMFEVKLSPAINWGSDLISLGYVLNLFI